MTSSVDNTGPDTEITRVEPSGPQATDPVDASVGGPSLSRGQQVGRYLVIDELGAGGMGEVFSAYDPELDRRVALKLVKVGKGRGSEGHTQGRARLLREAKALAKLSHPNVVAVYDAGTHGDRIFIAMEYVEGRTLRSWIDEASRREPAQTWPDALSLLLQAGRGLAAAHAEGLVHRDFKPANVMVSDDGRVRVLDFGLARSFGDTTHDELGNEAPVGASFDPLDSMDTSRHELGIRLTQTGMVMGTPAYMAPEQFFGGTIDARTDQFSFCIVAYRALLGQRPFKGETFRELARAVSRGELQEMPKAAKVPRHIQAALRRGLSVSRDARFPDMDALLAALAPPGRSRRQRLVLGGVVLGLAGMATALAVRATEGEAAPTPCQGAEDKLAGIWDDARREAMRTAFEATALPFAEDARAEVTRTLDAHTEHWVALHTEVCEATRIRGDQSEALMDLRIGCLDGKLRDVSALTRVLTEEVDAKVVENAVLGVQQLPRLDECATVDRRDAQRLQPDDPAIIESVAQARELLAEARALGVAGRFDDGVTKGEAALELAESTNYLPLRAETLALLGQMHDRLAEPAKTLEVYEEALYAATEAGHEQAQAQALLGLASVNGTHLGKTEDALRYARLAEAMVRRLGEPPELLGGVEIYRGTAYMIAKRLDEAEEQFQIATEKTAGVDAAIRMRLAALNNMAAIRGQQGHYREAVEAFAACLATAKTRMGPWHPFVASTHGNIGAAYSRLEEHELALENLERAIEISEKTLGKSNAEVARAYHNRGTVYVSMGDYDRALADYLHALEVKDATIGPDHPSTASSANNVGDALLRAGRAEEAIPYLERAIAAWTKTLGPDNPANLVGLVTLGEALVALERFEEAVPPLRRSLTLAQAGRLEPVEIATAEFAAAQAIWGANSDGSKERAEALALADDALAKYRASEKPAPKEIEAIETWLTARR